MYDAWYRYEHDRCRDAAFYSFALHISIVFCAHQPSLCNKVSQPRLYRRTTSGELSLRKNTNHLRARLCTSPNLRTAHGFLSPLELPYYSSHTNSCLYAVLHILLNNTGAKAHCFMYFTLSHRPLFSRLRIIPYMLPYLLTFLCVITSHTTNVKGSLILFLTVLSLLWLNTHVTSSPRLSWFTLHWWTISPQRHQIRRSTLNDILYGDVTHLQAYPSPSIAPILSYPCAQCPQLFVLWGLDLLCNNPVWFCLHLRPLHCHLSSTRIIKRNTPHYQ